MANDGQVDSLPATALITVGAAGARPANDDFASAARLTSGVALSGQTTAGATAEAGEPSILSDSGENGPNQTVWYTWTAPTDGVALWDITGSNIAAAGLYTGRSIGALTPASTSFTSGNGEIRLMARRGTTYRLAVDGDAAQFSILVNQQQPAGTTTVLTASTMRAELDQPVTFTATVNPNASSAATVNGTVVFRIDGQSTGPISVGNGEASYTPRSLSPGSHSVAAFYSGDDNFVASSSNTVTVNVSGVDARHPYHYLDGNGNAITIRLSGPGAASVQQADGQDAYVIAPRGTTAASTLTIDVAGSKSGHTTTIGEIRLGDAVLKRVYAPAVDLVGAGITADGDGQIRSITLHNLSNGADISLPGAAANAKVNIVANSIGDDSDLVFGLPVASAKFADFARGSLTAPSVGTLKVTGSAEDHQGNFAGNLYLMGSSWWAPGATSGNGELLGSLSVAHGILSSVIRVDGGIGSITAESLIATDIYAGYSGDGVPTSAADFSSLSRIRSIRIKGTGAADTAFVGNRIAASSIGSLSLAYPGMSPTSQIAAVALERLSTTELINAKRTTSTYTRVNKLGDAIAVPGVELILL